MQVGIHLTIGDPGCYPTNAKTYFDFEPHLNDETVIKIDGEDKTVGSLVRAGLQRVLGHGYWWVCLLLYGVIMNRGFLDAGGRNNNHKKKTNMVVGTGSFTESGSDEPVVMEMQSPVVAMDSDVGSYPPLPTQGTTPAGNTPGKSSYANVNGKPSGKKLNIRTLITPRGNGIDVVVLVESIRTISDRFAISAYGFFLGNRVAYPVVANYVKNTWGKYGLVCSMFSSSIGLFSFQFRSIEGLDAMLENDPWFIQINPLILKKWHPDENLLKEDVRTVPVWVKLHGVPVTAFSDDGLSVIATKLGTPLMLDSYIADMCMQS
ncbi:putative reverse transcriptase domain-containing protein [Tanacetum coccineum]